MISQVVSCELLLLTFRQSRRGLAVGPGGVGGKIWVGRKIKYIEGSGCAHTGSDPSLRVIKPAFAQRGRWGQFRCRFFPNEKSRNHPVSDRTANSSLFFDYLEIVIYIVCWLEILLGFPPRR